MRLRVAGMFNLKSLTNYNDKDIYNFIPTKCAMGFSNLPQLARGEGSEGSFLLINRLPNSDTK